MKRIIVLGMALLGLVAFPVVSMAEPEENIAFGSVISVSDSTIEIMEFDFETETEVPVKYKLTDETVYINVDSAGEFTAGEEVDVLYITQDGERVATSLMKSEGLAEDSGMASEEAAAPEDMMAPEDAMVDPAAEMGDPQEE